MDFEPSQQDELLRRGITELAENYDEAYWREHRSDHAFPEAIWNDLADGGWLGVALDEDYGGMGLGIQEMVQMLVELGRQGCWEAGNLLLLNAVFGGVPLQQHGTEEQKQTLLRGLVEGEERWCLGVTESDAGLNTKNLATTARKQGDQWVLSGQKMWISGAREASYCTLIARTTPPSEAERTRGGLSLFIVPMDRPGITLREIDMEGYFPDPTYEFDLDEVTVDEDMMLGEEGEGLYGLFDTLNVERIAVAAITLGGGYYALERAVEYANQREVFDAPIGSHQGIQHPLADAYADLELASLYARRAGWAYDTDHEDTGEMANVARLKGTQAAWNACEAAMTTFGGMSISKELGISALWQCVRHYRIAPVSEQMIRNYLGEHVLGLPRSY